MAPDDRRPWYEILAEATFGRTSASARDARRWIQVYRDLLEVQQNALNQVGEMSPGMTPDIRRECEKIDVPLLESEIDRLRDRMTFWEVRIRASE